MNTILATHQCGILGYIFQTYRRVWYTVEIAPYTDVFFTSNFCNVLDVVSYCSDICEAFRSNKSRRKIDLEKNQQKA